MSSEFVGGVVAGWAAWWLLDRLLRRSIFTLTWAVTGFAPAFVVIGVRPYQFRRWGSHTLVVGPQWWRNFWTLEQLPNASTMLAARRVWWGVRTLFAAFSLAAALSVGWTPALVAAGCYLVLLAFMAMLQFLGAGDLTPQAALVEGSTARLFERAASELDPAVRRYWSRRAAIGLAMAGAPAAATATLGDLPEEMPPDEVLAHHQVLAEIRRVLGDTRGMREAALAMRRVEDPGAADQAADVERIAMAIDGDVAGLESATESLGLRAELGDMGLLNLVRSMAEHDAPGVRAALWAPGATWGCDGWEVGARALLAGGDAGGAYRAAQQALWAAYAWWFSLEGDAQQESAARLARLLPLMDEAATAAKTPPPAFVAQVRQIVAAVPIDAPTAKS